jgi:hypothetical protein
MEHAFNVLATEHERLQERLEIVRDNIKDYLYHLETAYKESFELEQKILDIQEVLLDDTQEYCIKECDEEI